MSPSNSFRVEYKRMVSSAERCFPIDCDGCTVMIIEILYEVLIQLRKIDQGKNRADEWLANMSDQYKFSLHMDRRGLH